MIIYLLGLSAYIPFEQGSPHHLISNGVTTVIDGTQCLQ